MKPTAVTSPRGKEGTQMKSWLVEYVNEKGKKLTKRFETEKEVDAFCERLDEKITNGTCGGYICTVQKKGD